MFIGLAAMGLLPQAFQLVLLRAVMSTATPMVPLRLPSAPNRGSAKPQRHGSVDIPRSENGLPGRSSGPPGPESRVVILEEVADRHAA